MMRRITLFFLLLPSLAWARFDYQANLSFENENFLFDRQNHSKNDQETLEAELRLSFDNAKSFKALARPRLKLDFLDHRRNRYLPNEAYLVFYTPHHEFHGGFQLRHWGVANAFNPVDILNRRDFEDHFYDPEKLGELMVGWKGGAERAGVFSNATLEIIALPFFQEAPLPDRDTRFNLDGMAGIFPYAFLNREERLDYPEAMGLAARLSATVSPVDFGLIYYHGPDRAPGYVLRIDSTGGLRLTPFYYVTDTVGLTAAAAFGRFTPHIEAAYKTADANPAHPHDINFEGNDALPEDYFQYVAGVDYRMDDLFGSAANLVLSAEYLGEDSASDSLRNFRPFKNDLFLGVRYELQNRRAAYAEIAFIKDLSNNEFALKADLSSRIYRDLRLNVGGIWVNPTNEPFSPLSYFGNNSSVRAGLSYPFSATPKP